MEAIDSSQSEYWTTLTLQIYTSKAATLIIFALENVRCSVKYVTYIFHPFSLSLHNHLFHPLLSLSFPPSFRLTLSSTLVCNEWTQLIASFPHLHTRIRAYTKNMQRNTENAGKQFPALALVSDRKPLGDAKNRLLAKNGQGYTPSLPPKSVVPKRVMYKHRHCPQCRSSSKQLNLRRAECTNPKCKFDFCSGCFKSWHEGECERLKSPKRPSKEVTAGSKRSKKNLRRL